MRADQSPAAPVEDLPAFPNQGVEAAYGLVRESSPRPPQGGRAPGRRAPRSPPGQGQGQGQGAEGDRPPFPPLPESVAALPRLGWGPRGAQGWRWGREQAPARPPPRGRRKGATGTGWEQARQWGLPGTGAPPGSLLAPPRAASPAPGPPAARPRPAPGGHPGGGRPRDGCGHPGDARPAPGQRSMGHRLLAAAQPTGLPHAPAAGRARRRPSIRPALPAGLPAGTTTSTGAESPDLRRRGDDLIRRGHDLARWRDRLRRRWRG